MTSNLQPRPDETDDVAGHGATSNHLTPEAVDDVEGHSASSSRLAAESGDDDTEGHGVHAKV